MQTNKKFIAMHRSLCHPAIQKKLTLLLLLACSCFSLCFLTPAAEAAGGEGWPIEIDLPFGPDPGQDADLPTYVNTLYKFAVAAIGVFGVLMFVIGGFQYMTSAGNNAAVAEAKQTMVAAVAGIVIVVTAYLLLKTISPQFTELKNPFEGAAPAGSSGSSGSSEALGA